MLPKLCRREIKTSVNFQSGISVNRFSNNGTLMFMAENHREGGCCGVRLQRVRGQRFDDDFTENKGVLDIYELFHERVLDITPCWLSIISYPTKTRVQ